MTKAAKAAAGVNGAKRPVTVRIPADLLEQVRGAVAELGGLPQQMTMDSFAGAAFSRYLDHLRRTLRSDLGTASRGKSPRAGRPLRLIR